MDKYYLYVHYRESDGTPFYVGKGSGIRAWDFSAKGRNPYWHRTVKKHGIKVEIVFDNLSEQDAFDCETNAIIEFKYLGFRLTNMTVGGEGCSGLVHTDQQLLNISNGLKKVRTRPPKKEIKRPKSHGNGNHFADTNIYTFVRLQDGYQFTGTRHDICDEFNLSKQLIKKLFYKSNPRKSADGWRLKGINE